MADARLEPLSAFVDGEETDLQDVVRLLGEPEGVELLRDMLRLRLAAREGEPFALRASMVQAPATPARSSAPTATWRWSIAAALVAGFAGLGLGTLIPQAADENVPPEPTRVVRLEATPVKGGSR